jgi:hypothetical protein
VPIHAASLEWPQFAGPHRNFTSDAKGLANSWPASGPKKLWSRDLGEGYSGIAVDGAVLYTMYRRGSDEVTLAAATATGKTIWEHTENASFRSGMAMENGPGPHATPLVTADAVYAVGILAHLVCLDKKTGNVLLVARSLARIQRHADGPRIFGEPHRLERHGRHEGGRRGSRGDGLQPEGRQSRLAETGFQKLAVIAASHRR